MSSNLKLLFEVQDNNIQGVKKALRKGANINFILFWSGDFALKIAATSGDYFSIAQLLVEKGANINLVDEAGISALMIASESGNIRFLKWLLLYKADSDLQDIAGRTALMRACEYGHMEIAGELLYSDALVDIQDNKGKTALMNVCEMQEKEIVRLLLNFRAQVDLQDIEGKTALMIVCDTYSQESYKEDIIELLIQYSGAEVDLQDTKGRTALMMACKNSEVTESVIELLLMSGAKVNLQDNTGKTALMIACKTHKKEYNIIKLLLKHGAQVDLQDNEGKTAIMMDKRVLTDGAVIDLQDGKGRTALMRACNPESYNEIELQLLLNSGAQVDLQDAEGKTALMMACGNWRATESDVKLLLMSGANVNLLDKKGSSALMIACGEARVDKMKALINNRAEVDLQDYEGSTALMIACGSSKATESVVKLLLTSGAKANLQNNKGITALMIACDEEREECVKLLLHSGAKVDLQDSKGRTALMRACHPVSYDEETISALLNNGTQVDLQDAKGRTALMIACRVWMIAESVVRLLLKGGAQVNLKDAKGRVALGIALKFCTVNATEIAELLIKNGADIGLLDANQKSTLHKVLPDIVHGETVVPKISDREPSALIAASEKGQEDKVKLLLSDGAEINSKDSKGRTALIKASENGHTAIADLLIERGACLDIQDDEGCSALITACQNEHVQTTSRLLDEHADTFLRNSEARTAFDIAMKSNNAEILSLFNKLRSRPSYPGILFLEGVKRESVTTTEKSIDLEEVGISLSIPTDAISSTDPPLQLEIQPCFSGPFDVPKGLELVSPAYIVKPSRKLSFQKEVLIKIWHHANLESEEDCDDMVFLSASTTPEYRRNSPVYVFTEIKGAEGSFRPGEEQPVGEIALKHFCILASGKRKREEEDESDTRIGESEPKYRKSNCYSARLYKSIERKAVFCICLGQPQYIKNCNKVIALKYGVAESDLVLTTVNGVTIKDKVYISTNNAKEWITCFDKEPALISEGDIIFHESYDIGDSLDMDYPPRIEILIRDSPKAANSELLRVYVEGLNIEYSFTLLPDEYATTSHRIDTTQIKCVVSELKEEIQEQSKQSTSEATATLLPTAGEMLILMEAIDDLLQSTNCNDSVLNLVIKLDEMEKKSQQLNEISKKILSCVKIKCDMDVYVQRANTFAVQIKKVYMANMTHRTTPEWQSAISLFVTNAANLMKAIKDTLRASKLAQTIPNNFLPQEAMPPAQLPPMSQCITMESPGRTRTTDPLPPPKPLNTKDHTAAVYQCLFPLRARWMTIGTFLCIDHSSHLEVIKADYESSEDRLAALIAVWLRRHKPPPTWQALAAAVEYINPDKAEEIRRNTIHSSPVT